MRIRGVVIAITVGLERIGSSVVPVPAIPIALNRLQRKDMHLGAQRKAIKSYLQVVGRVLELMTTEIGMEIEVDFSAIYSDCYVHPQDRDRILLVAPIPIRDEPIRGGHIPALAIDGDAKRSAALGGSRSLRQ